MMVQVMPVPGARAPACQPLPPLGAVPHSEADSVAAGMGSQNSEGRRYYMKPHPCSAAAAASASPLAAASTWH